MCKLHRLTSAFLFSTLVADISVAQLGKSQRDQIRLRDALRTRLTNTVWVAYAPTNYNPDRNPPILPSEESIRADMDTLRRAGFDGVVTYGADVPAIPRIAEEAGFRSILLGVWMPGDREEMHRTKKAARSARVVGIIVGNEGLTFRRYDLARLRSAMDEMRRDTGKPVSTTEIIEAYFTKPEIAEWSDFLAVNAHPYFHAIRDPVAAADWTAKAFRNLAKRHPTKPLMFKEVGLPTAGEGLDEKKQFAYYDTLLKTNVKFVFFEAYDALFKSGSVEQSWGLFRADRTPKPAAALVRPFRR